MSLRADLEKVLLGFNDTLHKLDADIHTLHELIKEHFDANSKVPPSMPKNVERELKWPPTISSPTLGDTK